MIRLTRLNHREVAINCDLMEWVEATPDTTVRMVSGESILVLEAVEEVIRRIVAYRAQVLGDAGIAGLLASGCSLSPEGLQVRMRQACVKQAPAEPRDVECHDAPRLDAARCDATRLDAARYDTPRLDAPRLDAARSRVDEPRGRRFRAAQRIVEASDGRGASELDGDRHNAPREQTP